MDLSKVFDTIIHELLIAKLHAYMFSKDVLKLIFSCLSDWSQGTKIHKSFSPWSALLQWVPQGSVLGLILLNISFNDLFCVLPCDVCNFADDATPYVFNKNLQLLSYKIILILSLNGLKIIIWKWFHLFISVHKFEHLWADKICEAITF